MSKFQVGDAVETIVENSSMQKGETFIVSKIIDDEYVEVEENFFLTIHEDDLKIIE